LDKKTILIALLAIAAPCACITLFILVIPLSQGSEFGNVFGPVFFWTICLAPILLAGVSIVWIGLDGLRARQVSERLAAALGFVALTEADQPLRAWYGGRYRDHDVAIKTVVTRQRMYDSGSGYTAVFNASLRIVTAVNRSQPLRVIVQRHVKDRSPAAGFEEAFPGRRNAEKLSARSRQAMLDFVAKGYPTGLRGRTYRAKPGVRNLHLQDRADVAPAVLPPELLADAAVVLLHDQPNATAVTAEELRALLDDLLAVAATLEE